MLDGNLSGGADKVGTLHDMRFVFIDNDTRMLFATSFDGDWDVYIDDFVTKIPDFLDVIDSAWEGWPGIRSPQAKDYLVKHQITAEGWYVANPDLTVAEITTAEAHRQGGGRIPGQGRRRVAEREYSSCPRCGTGMDRESRGNKLDRAEGALTDATGFRPLYA